MVLTLATYKVDLPRIRMSVNMREQQRQLVIFIMFLFLFAGVGCAAGTDLNHFSSQSVVNTEGDCSEYADCDADGDGINSLCDEDDTDPFLDRVLPECDEDEDGYVDTPCTAYEDVDEDGFFTEIDREEIARNCDVCPGYHDPEQEDANQDGVGDLCSIEVNVNINAEPTENDSEIEYEENSEEPAEEVSITEIQ